MSISASDARRARGKIDLAADRLLSDYPFHARLISLMKLTEGDTVTRTMAVAPVGREVWLYYNPTFVLGITVAELVGVLLHETHHVVFRHLDMTAEDSPDD